MVNDLLTLRRRRRHRHVSCGAAPVVVRGRALCSSISSCPTAVGTPACETDFTVTPSPHHPIGAKGVGESANVGGVPAFSNAIVDAFAHLGVTHLPMPHTPARLWQVCHDLGLTGQPVAGMKPDPEVSTHRPRCCHLGAERTCQRAVSTGWS